MVLKYTENNMVWKQDKLKHEVLFQRVDIQCAGREKEPPWGGGGSPPGKYKGNDLWLIEKVCPQTKAFTILKLKKKKS